MVSIQPQSQYITDFNSPINSSMDKNPLAMLEKTCETIGLPDTPAKKSQNSPKSKDGSPTNGTDAKKDESSHNSTSNKKKDDAAKSPKVNSAVEKKITHGCEPSTSMAGMFPGFPAAMFQRYLPFGANGAPMMPPTAAGFPNHSAPFGMLPFGPVPVSAAMPHPGMVPGMHQLCGPMPTPHIVNGRPCMTPGCQTCAISAAQAHAAAIAASMGIGVPQMAAAQNQADMMQQFLQMQFLAAMQQQYVNPAAQNGVQLPPTSNSKSVDTYNNLMAAACGQLSRQVCPYVENNVPCGKTFANPEEMLHHYKAHLPNPPTTMSNPTTAPTHTSTTNGVTSSTPTSNEKKPTTSSPKTNGISLPSPNSANRFHPYGRPSSTANPAAVAQAQMQAQAASMAQAQQQMQMQQMLMQAFSAGLIPPQPGAPMPNSGIPVSAAFGMPPNVNPAAFNPAAFQAMYANRMLGAGIPGMPHT